MEHNDVAVGGAFLTEVLTAEQIFTPEQLSSEAHLMARTMDDFIRKEVLPVQDRLESHEDGLLKSLVQKAGALGLLAGTVPEAYGGLGLAKSALTILSERAAPNTSFAISIGVQTGIALLPLLYFGTEAQKQKYLPQLAMGELVGAFCLSEAGSGSDALAASAKAVLSPDGSHYLITGTKMWITNAEIADLFTVFAKVDGQQFTAFLVESGTPGLSLGREEHKLGIHGSSTRRVILDNCPVPVENVLGEVGKGYRPALYSLNIGRFNIGASALGNAKDVMRVATEYAKQRVQFGKPIAEFGAIKQKLSEMAVRLFVLESMVYRTAGYWDKLFEDIDYTSGSGREQLRSATEEYAIECAIIKFFGTEALAYVTDEGLQIHGGFGFSEEFPMARQYRDARISRIYEGTNEINRLTVVDQLVKRAAKKRLPLPSAIEAASLEFGKRDQELPACVRRLREAALFVIGQAWPELSEQFDDKQEIAMALSDICAAVFGAESAMLRASKFTEGSPQRDLADAAAQTFIRDASMLITDKAQFIISALNSVDADKAVARVAEYVSVETANTFSLRRKIAEAVVARGGYPWA